LNPRYIEHPRHNGGTNNTFLVVFGAVVQPSKSGFNAKWIWQTAEIPQNQKLNNLNKMLNLSRLTPLVLLRKTQRFAHFHE